MFRILGMYNFDSMLSQWNAHYRNSVSQISFCASKIIIARRHQKKKLEHLIIIEAITIMIESEQKISLSRAQRCILIISHLVISVTAYILPRIISGEQISTIGTVEVLMAWILGWQQGIWTWSYSEPLLSVLAWIIYG